MQKDSEDHGEALKAKTEADEKRLKVEARLEALGAEMHPDLEAYAKALQTLKTKMATVRPRAINRQIPTSNGPSLARGTGV